MVLGEARGMIRALYAHHHSYDHDRGDRTALACRRCDIGRAAWKIFSPLFNQCNRL